MGQYSGFWALFSVWLLGATLAAAAPGGRAPVITSHPQSLTVAPGVTATFSITATGDTPLVYRWVFNGALLAGATNATVAISSVSQANAGNYTAIVWNNHGYAISDTATLTLAQPSIPIITQHPQSQTVARGASITLSVGYGGNGPFGFQWRRNGANVAGATNETLNLSNIQPSDAGDYSVLVFTTAGATLSDTAAIRVALDLLPFRDQFDLQFTIPVSSGSGRASNSEATSEPGEPLHAGKTSGRSVWIAWQPSISGVATISLSGSSFDTLLAVYSGDVISGLTEVASDDDGAGYLSSRVTFNAIAGTHYKIAVDGLAGASGDFNFAWSLEPTTEQAPQIVMQPVSQTVSLGESAGFAVEATPANAHMQWLRNGQPLVGTVGSTLVFASVTESNIGVYSVRVTHGSRVVESVGASLQINSTGGAAQELLTSDKLADAIRIDHPLQLGQAVSPLRLSAMSTFAAAPPVNRGYSGTHLFSTFGAISEPGEPTHCNVAGGASYWFTFVALQSGEVSFDTEGSDFDTVLAVYVATGPGFGNLQTIACDNNSGADGTDSRVTFTAQAGVTYLIVIDGVRGAQGSVRLNYSLMTPAALTPLGRTVTGANRLRLTGQVGGTFEVQSSGDCVNWTRLFTTNMVTGVCDFADSASTNSGRRYYRALTLLP